VNLQLDLEIWGWLLVGLGCFAGLPVAAALWYGDPLLPYAASAVIALFFGLPVALSSRAPDRRLRTRDGFLVVCGAWAIATLYGAVPYWLTGTLSPVDAIFEAASGFTTTGSTVFTRIEGSQHGILLWRSLTQWVGGMGIILFAVAVLPFLGIGGMQLFRAEVPGPIKDKLTPRIADTARRLWYVYVGFTALACACYWAAGLGPFDALCHAMTTLATGGFSTRDLSVGAYGRPLLEWLVILFMIVAGTNFVLHWRLVTGRVREVWQDPEFRLYAGMTVVLVAVVAWNLGGRSIGAHLRGAAFQVVSILTTTGYATEDYEAWPALAQFVLFQLLLLGGMAGSTAGGLKSLRLLLGFRALRELVAGASHRHAVQTVRYAGRPVDDEVMKGVLVFFLAYGGLAIVTALVVASAGYDTLTALSASLTAIGNVGPGFGQIGPAENFSHFPGYVKLALSFAMIAGRLEIFTVLVLFSPHFWRR
jgi:trk/ktr system potassium uptake protein